MFPIAYIFSSSIDVMNHFNLTWIKNLLLSIPKLLSIQDSEFTFLLLINNFFL